MKNHLKAAAILAAILAAAPSCSNDDEGGAGTTSGDGDGDNASEETAVDTDDDGVPDGIDYNGDGEPEIKGKAIDVDDDGIWDGLDTNGDGTADVALPGQTISGGDGDVSGTGGTGSGIAIEFEACAADAREAEALPADILFMIDQSISMIDHTVPDNTDGAPTRWKVLRDAVLEFFNDEASAGLRVGMQFFPLAGDAELPEGGNSGVSCDVADYSVPEVGIAALPANAEALTGAYPETPDGGFTPSHPALEGALSQARDWAEMPENAGRGIAVVWVTDGFPTVCEERSISALAAVAEAYNNPPEGEIRVPTFVVGLGPVANLTVVAKAGGTGDGFFVAEDDGAVDELLSSLRRVANSPTLCEFDFPVAADGSPLDPDKVNMQYTTSEGTTVEAVRRTDGAASCGSKPGWYYDDPADPKKIYVCPSVCGNFGGGTVSIVAGCETLDIF